MKGTDKVKRISLFFNEDDQRASFVYDLLQDKGRKKTKFIIDLVLSSLNSLSEETDSQDETNNTIVIFDPNTDNEEQRKLLENLYSNNEAKQTSAPYYSKDDTVSSASPTANTTPNIPQSLPSSQSTEINPLPNTPNSNNSDPFLGKIMSGLSAFDNM